MYLLDTLFKDLRTIIPSVVIKYDKIAKKHETIDSLRESDMYVAAVNKQDNFYTYPSFDEQAIMNAGILDLNLVKQYAADKYKIPVNKRNRIIEEQRKLIIANYVEKNDYYRMLAGLPDIKDLDFIYVDQQTCIDLGLDPLKPIHEYSSDEIIKLDRNGHLERIRKIHPTKKYLHFLGENKIDIVRARTAPPFGLLRATKNISESFYADFNNVYEQCREYYMTVIYNKGYSNDYELYDNFIGLMIMVMAIQRLIVNAFKYGIERDFYDLSTIRMLFEAYNVPFIQNLPLDYQRILVRNLNNLLRYKSTDKVLYDICSLLGYERIKLFKYFLVKEHRLDINENPIFAYKEVENEDGTTSLVEDYEQMYNIYFQSVELKERNPALALSNATAKLDYNQVVIEDPYWWNDDEDLKKAIYESEFNYVETKFLSMNIMYKLTEMLFEVIYVFRMIMDKKDELTNITLELPKLFEGKKINLFHIVVLLCALISKKNNMAGNIIFTPSKALSVLGFNFYTDFDVIRKYIRENSDLLDQQMLKYIENLRIYGPEDVNELFSNIRALNDFIVAKLGSTQNLEEYRAYKKLYQALMVTEHNQELFKKSDGTIATTFLEYLDDVDVTLAMYIRNVEKESISEHIDHILFVLNNFMQDLKYLYILNDANNVVVNAITILTRFFKSYTTDLTSFNILYLMDSRYWNMIKLIHDVRSIEKRMQSIDTSALQQYSDKLSCSSGFTKEDMLNLLELFGMHGKITNRERDMIKDMMKSRETRLYMNEHTSFHQYADQALLETTMTEKETLGLLNFFGVHSSNKLREEYDIIDKISSAEVNYLCKLLIKLVERPMLLAESIVKNFFPMREKLFISSQLLGKEYLTTQELVHRIDKDVLCKDTSGVMAYADHLSTAQSNDKMKESYTLTDKVTLIWEI